MAKTFVEASLLALGDVEAEARGAAPQGDGAPEFQVTSEMVDAGLVVLDEMASVVSGAYLVEQLYRAMALACVSHTIACRPAIRELSPACYRPKPAVSPR